MRSGRIDAELTPARWRWGIALALAATVQVLLLVGVTRYWHPVVVTRSVAPAMTVALVTLPVVTAPPAENPPRPPPAELNPPRQSSTGVAASTPSSPIARAVSVTRVVAPAAVPPSPIARATAPIVTPAPAPSSPPAELNPPRPPFSKGGVVVTPAPLTRPHLTPLLPATASPATVPPVALPHLFTAPPVTPSPVPTAPVTAASLFANRAAALTQLQQHTLAAANAAGQRRVAVNANSRHPLYASYLAAWRHKVEQLGAVNYPAAAQRHPNSSLVLQATIRADGSLAAARVVQSSGDPELDAAAVQIVTLAAPFAPLPDTIRARADVLDITRTWRFR